MTNSLIIQGTLITPSETTCIIDVTSEVTINGNGKIEGNVNVKSDKFTLDSSSTINANYKGYPHGTREDGYTNACCGETSCGGGGFYGKGGFGCTGGCNGDNDKITKGNPSSTTSAAYGSGGGDPRYSTSCVSDPKQTSYSDGGDGGGSIKIEATSVIIKGSLVANGGNGGQKTYPAGGGSGGKIIIDASTLSVDPTYIIQTKGGKGSNRETTHCGGGGGGGFVSISYLSLLGTNEDDLRNKIDVTGGSAGFQSQYCSKGDDGSKIITSRAISFKITKPSSTSLLVGEQKTVNLKLQNTGDANANNVDVTFTPSCSLINIPLKNFPVINSFEEKSFSIDLKTSNTFDVDQFQLTKEVNCNVRIKVKVNGNEDDFPPEDLAVKITPKIDFTITFSPATSLSQPKEILPESELLIGNLTVQNSPGSIPLSFIVSEPSLLYLKYTNQPKQIPRLGSKTFEITSKSLSRASYPSLPKNLQTILKVTPCLYTNPNDCFTNTKTTDIFLKLIDLTLNTNPNEQSPRTFDAKTETSFNVEVGASFAGQDKTSFITIKDLYVNGVSCYTGNSQDQNGKKVARCSPPGLSVLKDGRKYDLEVKVDYQEGNVNFNGIKRLENDAVIYKDVTPPQLNVETNYNSALITITTVDNTRVSEVTTTMQYPGTTSPQTLTITSGGTYTLLNGDTEQIWTTIFSTDPTYKNKKHTLTITAKDLDGNTITQTYFPTFADTIFFNGNLRDVDDITKGGQASFILNSLISGITYSTSSDINGAYSKQIDQGEYQITVKNANKPFDEGDSIVFDKIILDTQEKATNKIVSFGESPAILQELPIDPIKTKTLAVVSDYSAQTSKKIIFNYRDLLEQLKINVDDLKIFHCQDWNFNAKACASTSLNPWMEYDKSNGLLLNESEYTASVIFNANEKIGAFALTELCDNCDEGLPLNLTSNETIIPEEGDDLVDKGIYETEEFRIEISLTNAELFPGENREYSIKFKNKINQDIEFKLNKDGGAAKFIRFEQNNIIVPGLQDDVLRLYVKIPSDVDIKRYVGNIIVDAVNIGKKAIFPVSLDIQELSEEDSLINVNVKFVTMTQDGKVLLLTQLTNIGKKSKSEAIIDYVIRDKEGNIVAQDSEFAEFYLIGSIQKTVTPKEKLGKGKYLIETLVIYGDNQIASAVDVFEIKRSFIQNILDVLKSKKLIGISLFAYVLFIIFGGLATFGVWYYRKKLEEKRLAALKFKVDIDLDTLPKPGLRSSLLGKVMEYDAKAYINLESLKLHSIVAGSTGGGKTVTAQVICEGALMNGVDVIVFDPSAQWSGFLKKCQESKMLNVYEKYGMKVENARAFLGKVKVVKDPREIVDVKEVLKNRETKKGKEGSITIYALNRLQPKDIDIFVANTIREVFDVHPEESEKLKVLLVYDEVHRLLEKFGGAGKGFVQIERGLREFRKWGIGIMLISQVLNDFIGEIKANITTEIQMRTRYEGDLDRLKDKYSDKISNALIRAPVGTGMFVNADYNKGRPYFFMTRPLLHSVTRLNDDELDKYGSYSDIVDDLKYKIEVLKRKRVNVAVVEAELSKANDNLLKGDLSGLSSNIAIINNYLTPIISRMPGIIFQKQTLVSEESIEASVEEANKSRSKYIQVEAPYNDAVKLYRDLNKKLGTIKVTIAVKEKLLEVEGQIRILRTKWNDRVAQLIKQKVNFVTKVIKKYL